MKVERQWITVIAGVLVVLEAGLNLTAQTAPPRAPSVPEHTFEFVSTEMIFEGKVVKGAPYSAEAVTETTQALADGNRISHKTNALLYRDREGRTRREQTLGAIGPWAASGDPPTIVFIQDPVARVNWVLEPRHKIARKGISFRWSSESGQGVGAAQPAGKPGEIVKNVVVAAEAPGPRSEVSVQVRKSESEEDVVIRGPAEAATLQESADARTESLGRRVIEGVEAVGTRSIRTIPAGKIGNELPIEIVSESWHSPELETVVMTRRSDPRFGETVYRLTNINRSDPPASLFEVPSDYTVKEDQSPVRILRMKKKEDE